MIRSTLSGLLMAVLLFMQGSGGYGLLATSSRYPMEPPSMPSRATPGPKLLSSEIVVTHDDSAAPPRCQPRELATLLLRFFDAFNRGDQDELVTFFGPEFRWYGVGTLRRQDNEEPGFFAYSPTSGYQSALPGSKAGTPREVLLPYFAQRHAQQERLRLLMVAGYANEDDSMSDITILLTRQASDLPPDRSSPEYVYQGKGQIHCPTQTIALWNVVQAPDDPALWLTPCPPLSTTRSWDAVIACAFEQ